MADAAVEPCTSPTTATTPRCCRAWSSVGRTPVIDVPPEPAHRDTAVPRSATHAPWRSAGGRSYRAAESRDRGDGDGDGGGPSHGENQRVCLVERHRPAHGSRRDPGDSSRRGTGAAGVQSTRTATAGAATRVSAEAEEGAISNGRTRRQFPGRLGSVARDGQIPYTLPVKSWRATRRP
jgi:hypothetical protein